MSTQTELFPDPPEAKPAEEASSGQPRVKPPPVWLQRTSLFILVLFCVYLGVFVTVLPWYTPVWDHNLFFLSHPGLWAILRQGWMRGVISGMGVLDIWIGISEAVHYRDQRN